MQIVQEQNNFRSFWMAGFECTDKLNAFGNRVDFLNITGHLNHIDEDYKNLKQFNIATVREGIRWSKVETRPYKYHWSTVANMIEAGKRNNLQQVWDLCHFGFPDDLTPLHPMFARRFSALCKAFVHFFRSLNPDDTLIIIPINEVSFISWLGGDVCGTTPYCKNYGWEVKYNLMRAYIEGIEAIKEIDDSVRIITSEPLVNIVAPLNATLEEVAIATSKHEHQFQVTDILCGKMCPELRGKPEYLDIVGLNYYYDNQWEYNTYHRLVWKDNPLDIRWRSLRNLMIEVYERYEKPIVITETSHPKEDRPLWIEMIAEECTAILKKDIPLLGVCLYPIIDRPNWDDLVTWHRSGVWDIDVNNNLKRNLYQPMAEALLRAQKELHPLNEVENILLSELC
jgi:beta-glucosidase/6-phospho-beta-glucosidase/beta-galactosidase